MNIRCEPRSVRTANDQPFELVTTITDCTPGEVTIWYSLPPGECRFMTPAGPAQTVSHSGFISGTTGAVTATLRVRCPGAGPTNPVFTLINVEARDSAGQGANDAVALEVG